MIYRQHLVFAQRKSLHLALQQCLCFSCYDGSLTCSRSPVRSWRLDMALLGAMCMRLLHTWCADQPKTQPNTHIHHHAQFHSTRPCPNPSEPQPAPNQSFDNQRPHITAFRDKHLTNYKYEPRVFLSSVPQSRS